MGVLKDWVWGHAVGRGAIHIGKQMEQDGQTLSQVPATRQWVAQRIEDHQKKKGTDRVLVF